MDGRAVRDAAGVVNSKRSPKCIKNRIVCSSSAKNIKLTSTCIQDGAICPATTPYSYCPGIDCGAVCHAAAQNTKITACIDSRCVCCGAGMDIHFTAGINGCLVCRTARGDIYCAAGINGGTFCDAAVQDMEAGVVVVAISDNVFGCRAAGNNHFAAGCDECAAQIFSSGDRAGTGGNDQSVLRQDQEPFFKHIVGPGGLLDQVTVVDDDFHGIVPELHRAELDVPKFSDSVCPKVRNRKFMHLDPIQVDRDDEGSAGGIAVVAHGEIEIELVIGAEKRSRFGRGLCVCKHDGFAVPFA